MSSTLRWFRIVVLVGVAINVFGMAIPFILAPRWYLEFFKLPGDEASVIWMRQAGLLLLSISLLYAPGGIDPARYRMNALFAVCVRMTIGLYWFFLVWVEKRTTAFVPFGALDCGYAVLNGWLYGKVRREL